MAIERVLVHSDLHLGREKGDYKHIKRNLIRLFGNYDLVVHNGDTFEIFWSKFLTDINKHLKESKRKLITDEDKLGYIQELASEEAYHKMRSIVAATPKTEHCAIKGNHECYEPFSVMMDHLESVFKNFTWHNEITEHCDCLFLHGDLPMGGNPEKRESFPLESVKAAKIYHKIATSHENSILKLLDHTVNDPEAVCRKTVDYLKKKHPEMLYKKNYIFIGHTHKPFEMKFEGFTIINTGTLLTDGRANPYELEIDTETGLTISAKALSSHALYVSSGKKDALAR